MKLVPLSINGAFLIKFNKVLDARGYFVKNYVASQFSEFNLRSDFKECYHSYSTVGVVRGMHYQEPPSAHAKLVLCLKGSATDVMLDLRSGRDYGRVCSVNLNSCNDEGVYLPEGVAHGFSTNIEPVLLMYFVTSEYDINNDLGVRWDSFGYDWGITNPILSDRDRSFAPFQNIKSRF